MKKNFIEELRWRNMIHDMTPGTEELLQKEYVSGYIGFDPTAPSLTIGNFVQIQLLKLFQRSGHRPLILMGGATGRIGDPSFKSEERDLLSNEEIEENLSCQVEQMKKYLDFESSENAAVLVNNLDFYRDMNVIDFLRNVGKKLTVNYMMSKEAVKSRMETGISFTEFSYQLLQANDFLRLYEKYACKIQMGGSDQWGNITAGTEFIRRNTESGKAYAVTTPLLTKKDGGKFGKSESGNIWLDPEKTSPYEFFQFWLNVDDADVEQYYRYFTLSNREDAEALIEESRNNPRKLKAVLAEEITSRVHSPEEYQIAHEVSEVLFNRKLDANKLKQLSRPVWKKLSVEIPSFQCSEFALRTEQSITHFLTENVPVFNSNSEVRRAIKSNALAVNKMKVSDHRMIVDKNQLIHNEYLLIENGKKKKFIVSVN